MMPASSHPNSVTEADVERLECRYHIRGCKFFRLVPRLSLCNTASSAGQASKHLRVSGMSRLRAHQSSECRVRDRTMHDARALVAGSMDAPTFAYPRLPPYTTTRQLIDHGIFFHPFAMPVNVVSFAFSPPFGWYRAGSQQPFFDQTAAVSVAAIASPATSNHAAQPEAIERTHEPNSSHEVGTECIVGDGDGDISGDILASVPSQSASAASSAACSLESPRSAGSKPSHSSSNSSSADPILRNRAELLVTNEALRLSVDLGQKRPDPSSWLKAIWLLSISLSKLPPVVAARFRPLLTDWRPRIEQTLKNARASKTDMRMFRAAYDDDVASRVFSQSNEIQPCVSKTLSSDPLADIATLASKMDILSVQLLKISTVAVGKRRSKSQSKSHSTCVKAADALSRCTRRVMGTVIELCLQLHFERDRALEDEDAGRKELECLVVDCLRALAQLVWRPMRDRRLLTKWLEAGIDSPSAIRRSVQAAIEQLLYLLTHCVYGQTSWTLHPEALDPDTIDLPALVDLISERAVRDWLRTSHRAELLAECVSVFHAAGSHDEVRTTWEVLLELAHQVESGDADTDIAKSDDDDDDDDDDECKQSPPQLLPPLLLLDGQPLNGTARVHLLNCLLLALQALYPSNPIAAAVEFQSHVKPSPKSSRKRSIALTLSPSKRGKQETSPSRLRVNPKQFHHSLHEAIDSTPLLLARNWPALRHRLERDGFLRLRGVLDATTLELVHRSFVEHLQSTHRKLQQNSDRLSATLEKVMGMDSVATRVSSDSGLRDALEHIIGDHSTPVTMLPEFTWPRAKPPRSATIVHADYSYFQHKSTFFADFALGDGDHDDPNCVLCQRSAVASTSTSRVLACNICSGRCHLLCLASDEGISNVTDRLGGLLSKQFLWHCKACAARPTKLWTCWIPLVKPNTTQSSRHDLSLARGDSLLTVLPGSHRLQGFHLPLQSSEELPGDYSASSASANARWSIASEMRRGDFLLFNVKTIHAATMQTNDQTRLSIDTRVTTSCQRN